MKNREIAEIFKRMGALLEMNDENVFKVRSYYKAADNILGLSEDIESLKSEDRLADISGVGKAMQEKIIEYIETGHVSAYEKLTKEIPESLLEIVDIPSVGPKKAKLFYSELKVKTLPELKKAAESGKLLTLPGIKKKTVENILRGIGVVSEGRERMNLGMATRTADEVLSQLKKLKEVKEISPAGSLRRGKETVRDIDILVTSTKPAKVMDAFIKLPQVKNVNAHGETKSSVLTKDNLQVDLRVVDKNCFGAALLYFTGSKNFNVKLRQVAQKQGKKVNEYGIFSVKGASEELLASKTEADCFRALGLDFVLPELREDIGEARLFSKKKLPKLIERSDIKGEFHVHSTYSDGRNSIEEMIQEARRRGYAYLAISDHSEKLRVAGGVLVKDLKKKKKEIDALNKKYKDITILFGTEAEIDLEGNLDYNDSILKDFDVVIGAVHTGFEQSRDKMTKRIIRACQNKHVDIIAHPTGVHLGKRKPYELDFKAVCEAAVDTNTCLEINSFPVRLDLNSQNIYFAREQGVKFVINTDSHAVAHMEHMKFGISLARRGWLSKADVVNTGSLKDIRKRFDGG